MSVPDRLETLLAQSAVTGIDFVLVHPDHRTLDVYFQLDPSAVIPPLPGSLPEADVYVTDTESGVRLPVSILSWPVVDGREVMRISVPAPGGFAPHRLRVEDSRIDPYANNIAFSFKADCRTGLDCAPPPHECPADDSINYPVDYLARDFHSLRRALLDFASRRHPAWVDRLEADVGIMWAELAAAVGDELAYTQDRWAREAHFPTAMLRRSVRRHARLVDYELDDGAASRTWLDVTVKGGGGTVTLPTGTAVRSADGAAVFEIGRGLHDPRAAYTAADARNEFTPHIWDEDKTCLPCGWTTLHVAGHHAADLTFDDFPPDGPAGTWVLLQTNPVSQGVPARAWPVRVVEVVDTDDPVRQLSITRLRWEAAQATKHEFDLEVLVVRGNLIPASAGATRQIDFHIDSPVPGDTSEATVERAGPDAVIRHRFTLPGSDELALAWMPQVGGSRPEVRLEQLDATGTPVAVPEWEWRRSLVGVNSSLSTDTHYTLEDGSWRRIAGYRTPTGEVVERDLATGAGSTLRFGDQEFATMPEDGTRFRVSYRLARGQRDDVAPRTLTVPAINPGGLLDKVTNPVAACGGRDPQLLADAQVDAPDAFRAVTYRAVRPEDYAKAVERLPWVQRAGASLRWTGSWLTVFAAPDPRGSVTLSPAQERELGEQLDRFRQAGREAWGGQPNYADLDLELRICVAPGVYRGKVQADVLEALVGHPEPCTGVRRGGFFHPDNFTFGTPLFRSALEAAVQAVPGVRAVEGVRIRRRSRFPWRDFEELVLRVAPDEVIRIAQDPSHPARGSVRLVMEGGA